MKKAAPARIRTRNQAHTALLYDLLHQWRDNTHLSKETSRLDGQKFLYNFIICTFPISYDTYKRVCWMDQWDASSQI